MLVRIASQSGIDEVHILPSTGSNLEENSANLGGTTSSGIVILETSPSLIAQEGRSSGTGASPPPAGKLCNDMSYPV